MFTIILISFFSGILTVLAPCVLPLLPVILGGSLAGQSKRRPYIIIVSLIVSLFLFTLLLKVSTVLINVDSSVWEYVSGGLLILFSVTLILPTTWTWFTGITGIEKFSQKSLESASHKEGILGPIMLGAALGPVFSSCNPTYTLLLSIILPEKVSWFGGSYLRIELLALLAYFIGLGFILLLIVHFGRGIIGRFSFFANPRGLFRRTLGIIILIVGVLIVTGDIKRLETYVVENNIFIDTASLDNTLNNIALKNHNDTGDTCKSGKCDAKKDPNVLMDIEKAPELTGLAAWINSSPLTLKSLKGKVVLIDFWTYSCINCQRTQPYLNAWYDTYEKDGLVIIGVHAPEFAFEKVENNVCGAVKNAGIRYPVALDNDFKTWNAYGNRYWPAKYLIDQNGNIIFKHFGEGAYGETEGRIKSLLTSFLKEEGKTEGKKEDFMNNKSSVTPNAGQLLQKGVHQKTPETYLGSSRGHLITEKGDHLGLDQWQAFGPWKQESEYLAATQEGNLLRLNFRAKDVYLVVSGGKSSIQATTYVYTNDGKMIKQKALQEKDISVTRDDLYHVFSGENPGEYTLQLIVTPGLRLHAFTFGD